MTFRKEVVLKSASAIWIGKHPTRLQGVYQTLYFDFSKANLGRGTLEDNFNDYCSVQLNDFFSTYAEYYQDEKEFDRIVASTEASTKLHWLEATARRLGHLLYLIIMCIPNNCVREQYLGFLREYYQQHGEMYLPHLQ